MHRGVRCKTPSAGPTEERGTGEGTGTGTGGSRGVLLLLRHGLQSAVLCSMRCRCWAKRKAGWLGDSKASRLDGNRKVTSQVTAPVVRCFRVDVDVGSACAHMNSCARTSGPSGDCGAMARFVVEDNEGRPCGDRSPLKVPLAAPQKSAWQGL